MLEITFVLRLSYPNHTDNNKYHNILNSATTAWETPCQSSLQWELCTWPRNVQAEYGKTNTTEDALENHRLQVPVKLLHKQVNVVSTACLFAVPHYVPTQNYPSTLEWPLKTANLLDQCMFNLSFRCAFPTAVKWCFQNSITAKAHCQNSAVGPW